MGKGWNTVKRLRSQGFIHYVKVATHLRLSCHGQFTRLQTIIFFKELAKVTTSGEKASNVTAAGFRQEEGKFTCDKAVRFSPSSTQFPRARASCLRMSVWPGFKPQAVLPCL